MKRFIVAAIIALFLVPIMYRSISYFRQNKDIKAKVEPDERRLIGRVSERNSRVKEIQEILQSEGFEVGEADGFMGPQTRDAIKSFQKAKSLKSSGTIDQATLTSLESFKKANVFKEDLDVINKASDVTAPESVRIPKEKVEPPEKSPEPTIHDEILNYRLNSKDHIMKIQAALKKSGFYKGEIDGKMGPRTKSAIKEFQRAKKLTSDGVVGSKTWEALNQYLKN